MKGKNVTDVNLIWFQLMNFQFLPVLDDLSSRYPDITIMVFDGRRNKNSVELNLTAREYYNEYDKLLKLEIMHFGGKLKEIPSKFLKHAANLREFFANHNDIKTLPGDLFSNSPNLTSVDFSYNRIKMIPDDLFATNPKMTHINLGYNNIATLSATMFKFNPLLEELTADRYAMNTIPGSFFEKNPMVRKKFPEFK